MDKQGWEIDNPVRAIDIRCHQYSQEPPMVDWPAVLEAARAVLAGTEMTSGILRLTKEGWAHLSAQHPQPRHEVIGVNDEGGAPVVVLRIWLAAEGVNHG